MRILAINPELISDNNTFTFKNVPSMYNGFTDVYYKGQRIAILNGLSAPLQWTAKNGSNIPVKVIDQLEKMVFRMMKKTKYCPSCGATIKNNDVFCANCI